MDYKNVLGERKFPTYEQLKTGLLQLIDEGKISHEDASRLLPELRESKDERIRKEIITLLQEIAEDDDFCGTEHCKEYIAYLEKQKEQKSVENKDLSKCSEDIQEFMEIFCEDQPKAYWDGVADTLEWIKEHPDNQFVQKPAENSTRTKIISRATSEKQVVLLSESDGNAEIGWDTRSLEDTKKLLEYGLAFINKQLNINPVEWSEDDRIKHALIEFLREAYSRGNAPEECAKWLVWLDQPKEQKPVLTAKEAWKEMRLEVYAQASGNRHEPNCSDDSTKIFSLCDIDEIVEKIGDSIVEQKPAEWSEEDELMRKRCIADLGYLTEYEPQYKERYDAQMEWLKSLRPQPKQEWSKEDENKIERLSFLISVVAEKEMISEEECIDLRNFIKSIRPQPHEEKLM